MQYTHIRARTETKQRLSELAKAQNVSLIEYLDQLSKRKAKKRLKT